MDEHNNGVTMIKTLSDIQVGDVIHFNFGNSVEIIPADARYNNLTSLSFDELREYWNEDFTDRLGEPKMDITKVERRTTELIWEK